MRPKGVEAYLKPEDRQGYVFFKNHTGKILVWCVESCNLDGVATYGMGWHSSSTNDPIVWMELFPPGPEDYLQECVDATHDRCCITYEIAKNFIAEMEFADPFP